MLHHLVDYARTHNLDPEPGFAPKTARWAIRFSSSGEFTGIVELGDASQKNNKGREFPKAPDLSQPEMKAGGVTKSHFLIETVDVLTGEEKIEKRLYFIELLHQAAAAMPLLNTAARWLESEDSLRALRQGFAEQNAKEIDKATLMIGGEFPVNAYLWHDWWKKFRVSLSRQEKNMGRMICMLSGELAEPAATHPKIKGLVSVGGLATGDVLIGFKQESFCSYGMAQSANAAMSERSASAYQTALNELIAKHGRRLAGAMIVHWFQSNVGPDDDPFEFLALGEEDRERSGQRRARELLESIHTGSRPDLAGNLYYAGTLSSNAGRVVIRDWMEGGFKELLQNVDRWFSDLRIVHRDGGGLAPSPKFAAVLGALVRELKDIPSPMEASLFHAAVRGESIPYAAAAQAYARARIGIIQGEPPLHARFGLLRAWHLRNARSNGDLTMEQNLTPDLNLTFPDAAYQCGRLMAALGKIQRDALGDVGAGVVQRFYAAASATPALVFGRLIRGAQFHLDKVRPPVRIHHERLLSEICGRIGTAMPSTFSLQQQTLFALGYYQQLADLYKPRPAEETPSEEPTEE